MNEKHLYILLDVINKNGDIRRLKREGIPYLTISKLTKTAILNNYALYKDDILSISDIGLKKIEELANHYKLVDKKLWIDKEENSKVQKLEEDFIFLPNQSEIPINDNEQ